MGGDGVVARGRRFARRYLAPPCGVQVRRLLAWMMLAAGVPRLPGLSDVLPVGRLRAGDPEMMGVVLLLVGVLMLATCYRWRLTLFGRMTAALSFACWVTLAAVTTSATSFMVDLGMAACALAEVWTLRDG